MMTMQIPAGALGKIISVLIIGLVCIFWLQFLANNSQKEMKLPPHVPWQNFETQFSMPKAPNNLAWDFEWKALNLKQSKYSQILTQHKVKLDQETSFLPLPKDKFPTKPRRVMLASSWRSGSTFLGRILYSYPGTFFHYEPFMNNGIVMMRDMQEEMSIDGVQDIKRMFKCEFSKLSHIYGNKCPNRMIFFNKNFRIGPLCELKSKRQCCDMSFMTEVCRLYPFQLMKVNRVRYGPLNHLLEHNDIDLKVVLLVRDPRGTLNSRKELKWCTKEEDCFNYKTVCQDLEGDFKFAKEMIKKYPDNLLVLRYEDLCNDVQGETVRLFNFLDYGLKEQTQKFLDKNTKFSRGGRASVSRNTRANIFKWKKNLTFGQIEAIQDQCQNAFDVWGYQSYTKDSLKDNTLKNYSLLIL